MLMIRLQLVNEENFEQVTQLKLDKEDGRCVASPLYALAQSWLHRDDELIFPYAVLSGNKVVGFVQLVKHQNKQEWLIWRLMIDREQRNQGFGKETLRQIIRLAQSDAFCQRLTVEYVIGNHRMRGLLESFGFESKGFEKGQISMVKIVK